MSPKSSKSEEDPAMLRRRRDFMAIEDGQLALQNHGQGHQATDLAISGAAGMGETPKSDAGQTDDDRCSDYCAVIIFF